MRYTGILFLKRPGVGSREKLFTNTHSCFTRCTWNGSRQKFFITTCLWVFFQNVHKIATDITFYALWCYGIVLREFESGFDFVFRWRFKQCSVCLCLWAARRGEGGRRTRARARKGLGEAGERVVQGTAGPRLLGAPWRPQGQVEARADARRKPDPQEAPEQGPEACPKRRAPPESFFLGTERTE